MQAGQPPAATVSVALFASGSGSNVAALLEHRYRGAVRPCYRCLIGNNSGARAMAWAREHGVSAYHVSRHTHPQRDAYLARPRGDPHRAPDRVDRASRLHEAAAGGDRAPLAGAAYSTSTRRCCRATAGAACTDWRRIARCWPLASARPALPCTSWTNSTTAGRSSCSARCRCAPAIPRRPWRGACSRPSTIPTGARWSRRRPRWRTGVRAGQPVRRPRHRQGLPAGAAVPANRTKCEAAGRRRLSHGPRHPVCRPYCPVPGRWRLATGKMAGVATGDAAERPRRPADSRRSRMRRPPRAVASRRNRTRQTPGAAAHRGDQKRASRFAAWRAALRAPGPHEPAGGARTRGGGQPWQPLRRHRPRPRPGGAAGTGRRRRAAGAPPHRAHPRYLAQHHHLQRQPRRRLRCLHQPLPRLRARLRLLLRAAHPRIPGHVGGPRFRDQDRGQGGRPPRCCAPSSPAPAGGHRRSA